MVKTERTMTPKQARFVEEYLIDLNATQAAIRAGFSARRAAEIGYQLVRKTTVASAIQAAKAKRSEATGITAEDVVRELRAIALSDIGDVIDFATGTLRIRDLKAIPADARRAFASVRIRCAVEKRGDDAVSVELIEFNFHDKLAALRELALHLPGFRAAAKVEIGDPRTELARMLGVAVEELPSADSPSR